VAAQALNGRRAGPALSTIDRASGRVRAVLFRAVPRAANRARPIWNSIQLINAKIPTLKPDDATMQSQPIDAHQALACTAIQTTL
jgi:hypothetical protein